MLVELCEVKQLLGETRPVASFLLLTDSFELLVFNLDLIQLISEMQDTVVSLLLIIETNVRAGETPEDDGGT